MAGVKGMKWRSSRSGSGQKPKENPVVDSVLPLDFLLSVQNNPSASPILRVRAAIAAAQYMHLKKGDGGKKDEQALSAKKAGTGRFAAATAPLKLISR